MGKDKKEVGGGVYVNISEGKNIYIFFKHSTPLFKCRCNQERERDNFLFFYNYADLSEQAMPNSKLDRQIEIRGRLDRWIDIGIWQTQAKHSWIESAKYNLF